MVVALIINTISVLFAWLEGSGKFKQGLKFSMITIFVFLALRFDYGNDYLGYLNLYLKVNSDYFFDLNNYEIKGNEIAWLYLNRFFSLIFGSLGFFAVTTVLAAFTSFVVYRFIKKYVPSQYHWFAVFYFVFNFETMLILCSAMRQAVAITFFLLAFDFIIKRNLLKFLLLIFAGSLFHNSAIYLVIIYLLGSIKIRVHKIHILLLFGFFLNLIVYFDFVSRQIFQFTSLYFEYYSIYETGDFGERSIGFGFAINLLILTYVLFISLKDKNIENNLISKIVLLSIFIIPLSLINPMITRLNYYLLPLMMLIFPITFNLVGSKLIRTLFVWIIVLFTLYTFIAFHYSPIHGPYFMKYKTFFSSPLLNQWILY